MRIREILFYYRCSSTQSAYQVDTTDRILSNYVVRIIHYYLWVTSPKYHCLKFHDAEWICKLRINDLPAI